MKVEVWSDIACPYCWLGKHHLQEALRRSGATDVEVEFRSFELQPDARRARPVREYLAERYGSLAQVDAAHERLARAGRAVGIAFDFERALMANTFDAHRVHHLAKARGLGERVMERFLRARQGEGADMSDHATLRRLALEAGLDGAEVDEVLASDAYAAAVRADEAQARAYGIHGVPFFLFDGRYAVNGAQPVEVFEQAIAAARGQAAEPAP
ncbi:MAG TPA: DsbA family oxidoreductase [Candidatus Thermoplasmatota archaeon]|nr:DsbA family oxidoreductase [Candidatus Thermoplasmatota archaeon]